MSFLPAIEGHFALLASAIVDPDNPMWPSVLDVRTGRIPAGVHTPRRVYRLIGAPRGSTLYWDQPLVVAAYALAKLTGVELVTPAFFNEFTLRLPKPAAGVVDALAAKGILAGVPTSRLGGAADLLIVAVTETATDDDFAALEAALKETLS